MSVHPDIRFLSKLGRSIPTCDIELISFAWEIALEMGAVEAMCEQLPVDSIKLLGAAADRTLLENGPDFEGYSSGAVPLDQDYRKRASFIPRDFYEKLVTIAKEKM